MRQWNYRNIKDFFQKNLILLLNLARKTSKTQKIYGYFEKQLFHLTIHRESMYIKENSLYQLHMTNVA